MNRRNNMQVYSRAISISFLQITFGPEASAHTIPDIFYKHLNITETHTCMQVSIYTCIYTYMHTEREKKRDRDRKGKLVSDEFH
jgi:hypothetical protein